MRKIIFILLFCAFGLARGEELVGEASYADYYIPEAYSLAGDKGVVSLREYWISEKNGMIGYSDGAQKAEFCSGADYVCVRSKFLKFSFPMTERIKQWHKDGVHYVLLGKANVSILGENLDVFVVRGADDGDAVIHQFFFSIERGLLGFGRLSDEGQSAIFYWSNKRCGFGGRKEFCR